MALTPEEASMRGRLGALTLHSTHDSRKITEPARLAFAERFLRDVDPDGLLPEAERLRRADLARKAFFTRLALKSAQVRRRRKADSDGR